MLPIISNRLAAKLVDSEEWSPPEGEWFNRIRKDYCVPFWQVVPHQTRRAKKDIRSLYVLPLVRCNEPMKDSPFWEYLERHEGKENLVVCLQSFCPDFSTDRHYITQGQLRSYRYTFEHFYWCKYRGI